MNLSPPLQQVDRVFVRSGGRRFVYFGGCDYFRMASHPEVVSAAATALRRYGLNVAASRITTGNHVLYEKLEAALAGFFGVECATLASSGYAPNLIVAQALAGRYTQALIDERAHGSLVDAAGILGCQVISFRHCDPEDFARQLKRVGKGRPIILTDGMFSHDGAIAPLKEYLSLLPARGTILLDDAHGAGVLGRQGRGSAEYAEIGRNQIIQTITLSKGFGAYGGAILGTNRLREEILRRSRFFTGNTPLPLPLVGAALAALRVLRKNPGLRARLGSNVSRVKANLRAAGVPVADSPSPIIAMVPRTAGESAALGKNLLLRGIHAPHIKYPGAPKSGYFRFAVSSEHTADQLDDLANAISSAVG